MRVVYGYNCIVSQPNCLLQLHEDLTRDGRWDELGDSDEGAYVRNLKLESSQLY